MTTRFSTPLHESDPRHTEAYNYDLDEALIAGKPSDRREDSRLLATSPNTLSLDDVTFKEIGNYLQAKDRLVFNNTKVLPGRIFVQKPTGGRVELLILDLHGRQWTTRVEQNDMLLECMTRSSKPLRPNTTLTLWGESHKEASPTFTIEHADSGLATVRCKGWQGTPQELLEYAGQIPLPPYIVKRRREQEDAQDAYTPEQDRQRYQTVYAKHPGAVAAPTAGLHFSEELLKQLQAGGIDQSFVTLHVGPGTFKPVDTDTLTEHPMHQETYIVGETLRQELQATREAGGRIIAVGTTSARVLETEARKANPFLAGEYETELFLYPGDGPKLCDGLITNFHLPKSTLLALVASMIGYERMRDIYEHAMQERYRFYSYGDSMLLWNMTRAAEKEGV